MQKLILIHSVVTTVLRFSWISGLTIILKRP